MITQTNFKLSSINLKKSFQYNALFPGCVFSFPPAILTKIYNKNKSDLQVKILQQQQKRFNIQGTVTSLNSSLVLTSLSFLYGLNKTQSFKHTNHTSLVHRKQNILLPRLRNKRKLRHPQRSTREHF